MSIAEAVSQSWILLPVRVVVYGILGFVSVGFVWGWGWG